MNERIKELAERAYGTRKHVPPVWQFYDSELEELVELVVRECLLTMETGCDGDLDLAIWTIKKDFGL